MVYINNNISWNLLFQKIADASLLKMIKNFNLDLDVVDGKDPIQIKEQLTEYTKSIGNAARLSKKWMHFLLENYYECVLKFNFSWNDFWR